MPKPTRKKKTKIDKDQLMLDALKDIGVGLRNVLEKLEERDGRTTPVGRDVTPRVQPVRVTGAPHQPAPSEKPRHVGRADRPGDRGDDRRGAEEAAGPSLEERRRGEVAALDGGSDSAVASFRPPDAAAEPPPRSSVVTVLWEVDDQIPCQTCKEPIYVVRKQLTTASKLSDIPGSLEPYSDAIPALTGEEPAKTVGGVALNCPRCKAAFGVVIV